MHLSATWHTIVRTCMDIMHIAIYTMGDRNRPILLENT
jgi:hypothetical protein